MNYLCVFGNPIAHSLSPLLHNAVFESLALPYIYGRFCLQSGECLRESFDMLNLCGANITLPFKEYAYHQADIIDPLAKNIGAVNTLVRAQNGTIIGYNTDATGFLATLVMAGFEVGSKMPQGQMTLPSHIPTKDRINSALILGAGGSAKALACVLHDCGVQVMVANRSNTQESFFTSQAIPFCTFDTLESSKHFDIIINATSASLKNTLPLPESSLRPLLSNTKLAYDLMYGRKTPFLCLSDSLGIASQDGADMLIMQAVYAQKLFCPQIRDEIRSYTIMRSVFKA